MYRHINLKYFFNELTYAISHTRNREDQLPPIERALKTELVIVLAAHLLIILLVQVPIVHDRKGCTYAQEQGPSTRFPGKEK